jgi:phage-related baseplate assembly protein
MREKLAEQDKILRKITFQLAKVNLDSRMQQLGATPEADKELRKRLNAISERSSMAGLFKFPSMVNES